MQSFSPEQQDLNPQADWSHRDLQSIFRGHAALSSVPQHFQRRSIFLACSVGLCCPALVTPTMFVARSTQPRWVVEILLFPLQRDNPAPGPPLVRTARRSGHASCVTAPLPRAALPDSTVMADGRAVFSSSSSSSSPATRVVIREVLGKMAPRNPTCELEPTQEESPELTGSSSASDEQPAPAGDDSSSKEEARYDFPHELDPQQSIIQFPVVHSLSPRLATQDLHHHVVRGVPFVQGTSFEVAQAALTLAPWRRGPNLCANGASDDGEAALRSPTESGGRA
jgi:hypothetical protein